MLQRPRSLVALRAALIAVVVALALAACSSDDGADAPATATGAPPAMALDDVTSAGRFGVGVTTLQLTDTSRPTAPNGDFGGAPERRMAVEVWYPATVVPGSDGRDAPADNSGAPHPLIVFAHGYTSSRVQSTTYTRHLASHGYVVASPDFPLTSAVAPGGPVLADVVNQPGDVSFIIDSLISLSAGDGRLAGAIDRERIGLTGHSGGGFTTLLAVYGPDRDERIDAALPLSASGCVLGDGPYREVDTAVMFMTGSEDLLVPRGGNRDAFDNADAPAYWVELVGGGHVRFADADIDDSLVADRVRARVAGEAQSGDEPHPFAACVRDPDPLGAPNINLARQQELLRAFATPFFAAYLRDDADALRFLRDSIGGLTDGAVAYEVK
jgi:dienelactone hydrolase